MSETLYDQLETSMENGGIDAVLEKLITSLQAEKKYHELFEALKNAGTTPNRPSLCFTVNPVMNWKILNE